jgi:hypothetical protein
MIGPAAETVAPMLPLNPAFYRLPSSLAPLTDLIMQPKPGATSAGPSSTVSSIVGGGVILMDAGAERLAGLSRPSRGMPGVASS